MSKIPWVSTKEKSTLPDLLRMFLGDQDHVSADCPHLWLALTVTLYPLGYDFQWTATLETRDWLPLPQLHLSLPFYPVHNTAKCETKKNASVNNIPWSVDEFKIDFTALTKRTLTGRFLYSHTWENSFPLFLFQFPGSPNDHDHETSREITVCEIRLIWKGCCFVK